MGWKDLMKNATEKANSVANMAQSKITEAQQTSAIRKEEDQRKLEEMKGRISVYESSLMERILEGFSGEPYFTTDDSLHDFTKEFYEKLLLPANSVSTSKLTMYPYSDKIKKSVRKTIPDFPDGEAPVLQFSGDKSAFLVLTANNLYLSFEFPENPVFFGSLCIGINNISNLIFDYAQNECTVLCNGVPVFTAHNVQEFDIITLNEYMRRLSQKDYEIIDTQIDTIIRGKIGENIVKIIKQYVFDDELLIYFAWGMDSITAKDFVVCTDKQILMLDREMLGATKNIKQFYYEDITSMSTDQKTNGVLDFALTVAFKLCNITIYVSGAQEKIQNLFTYEAERVVRVYQEYRRSIKQEEKNNRQVVIQQSAPQDDVFAKLEKLNKLKEAGILTEEEFNAKKADLLAQM